jgi:hypothetical protein
LSNVQTSLPPFKPTMGFAGQGSFLQTQPVPVG